jgi:hypothetical protein
MPIMVAFKIAPLEFKTAGGKLIAVVEEISATETYKPLHGYLKHLDGSVYLENGERKRVLWGLDGLSSREHSWNVDMFGAEFSALVVVARRLQGE